MRRIRSTTIGVAALLAAVGVALLAAQPAAAEVTGGCNGALNGVIFTNLPLNVSDAIVVGKNDTPPMAMMAPGGKSFSNLSISLVFFGLDWSVYDAPAGGGTWAHNIDVHSFARFGVGLYKLHGISEFVGGGGCDGDVLIKVTGDPFSSVAGIAAAAASGAGALSVLGAGVAAGGNRGGGSGTAGSVTGDDRKGEEEREKEEEKRKRTHDDMMESIEDAKRGKCFLGTLAVIALLPLVLLFGTGALMMAVVVPVGVKVRRKTWPLVLGAVGGLFMGLGAGVLLQEYAVIYPTRTWSIIYLAGGIAFGLAVPLLRRSLSR